MKPSWWMVTILLVGALAFVLGIGVFMTRAAARNAALARNAAIAQGEVKTGADRSPLPNGAYSPSLAEQAGRPPQPGSPAPDFTLPANDGREVSLASLRGHPVVLYFYPKDETPGCTKEACDFRDHTADLKKAGVVVLGVSTQDLASHRHFAAKEKIPFPLLSDPQGRVAALYGVQVHDIPGVGRVFQRTTFVIDKDGRVARVWPNVNVIGHVKQVLEFVRAPGGA